MIILIKVPRRSELESRLTLWESAFSRDLACFPWCGSSCRSSRDTWMALSQHGSACESSSSIFLRISYHRSVQGRNKEKQHSESACELTEELWSWMPLGTCANCIWTWCSSSHQSKSSHGFKRKLNLTRSMLPKTLSQTKFFSQYCSSVFYVFVTSFQAKKLAEDRS